eukprot:scaffold5380_cov131-Cylindrotheca_fusiformis.AAC.17
MSALRPAVSRSVAQATRLQLRTRSTVAFPPRGNANFKKTWLSDPSTYPIIAIMGCGLTFMVGMGLNALTYKDVQINPSKRTAMLTNWGEEHQTRVVERFTLAKGGVKTEGLGIDHEEWQRKKDEYMSK